jgi:hypothetical protein
MNSLDIVFLEKLLKTIASGVCPNRNDLDGIFTKEIKRIQKIQLPANINLFCKYLREDFNMKKGAGSFLIKLKDDYIAEFYKVARDISNLDLKNKPGFLVFSEYFFGNEPFPDDFANSIASKFSSVDPRKIVACNFLTFAHRDEFAEMDIGNFNVYKSEYPEDSTPSNRSSKRCETDIQLPCGIPKMKLENKTFFYNNRILFAFYKKSTYSKEYGWSIEDSLVRGLAYYSFGNWRTTPCLSSRDASAALMNHFLSNVSPQICLDYCFKKHNPHANFQMIQSCTIPPPNLDRTGYLKQNTAKYVIFCDSTLASINREMYGDISSLYWSPARARGDIQMKNRTYAKSVPYRVTFTLNNIQFVITIDRIVIDT